MYRAIQAAGYIRVSDARATQRIGLWIGFHFTPFSGDRFLICQTFVHAPLRATLSLLHLVFRSILGASCLEPSEAAAAIIALELVAINLKLTLNNHRFVLYKSSSKTENL